MRGIFAALGQLRQRIRKFRHGHVKTRVRERLRRQQRLIALQRGAPVHPCGNDRAEHLQELLEPLNLLRTASSTSSLGRGARRVRGAGRRGRGFGVSRIRQALSRRNKDK